MKFLLPIIIILFVLFACVSPYEFESGNAQVLVVEGMLTDKDSSYVSVKRSDQSFNSAIGNSVKEAKVYVLENGSNKMEYYWSESADLFIPIFHDYRAKAGNSYQLFIELPDGQLYMTDPDTIKNIEQQVSFSSNNNLRKDYFQLYANHPPKTGNEFYLYKFINYKRATYCAECLNSQLYDVLDSSRCGSPFRNCNNLNSGSARTDYYGFVCDANTKAWNYKKLREYYIYGNEKLKEGTEQSLAILDVPVSSFDRYFIEVHQNSITKGAYEYFQLLQQAGERSGTLFDPTPPLIYGNVYQKTDPNTKSLGYFIVAGQQVYGYFIDRSNGKLTARDPEKEYFEHILFTAPAFPGCPSPPLSVKIINNNYRTDREPVGWKTLF